MEVNNGWLPTQCLLKCSMIFDEDHNEASPHVLVSAQNEICWSQFVSVFVTLIHIPMIVQPYRNVNKNPKSWTYSNNVNFNFSGSFLYPFNHLFSFIYQKDMRVNKENRTYSQRKQTGHIYSFVYLMFIAQTKYIQRNWSQCVCSVCTRKKTETCKKTRKKKYFVVVSSTIFHVNIKYPEGFPENKM